MEASRPRYPAIELDEINRLCGAPTVINLHLQDTISSEVATQFLAQAGITRRPQPLGPKNRPPAGRKIAVDFDQVPFWQALARLNKLDRQAFYSYASALPRWDFSSAVPAPEAPHQDLGLFQVQVDAIELSRSRTKSFVNTEMEPAARVDAGKEQIAVRLKLFSDPKVRDMYMGVSMGTSTVSEATDENGQSLLSDSPSNTLMDLNPLARSINLRLSRTDTKGQKIATLKGTVRVLLVTKSQKWEVNNILRAGRVTTVADQKDLVLDPVTERDDGYLLRVTANDPTPDDVKAHRGSILNRARVTLLDSDGYEMRTTSYSSGGRGGALQPGLSHIEARFSKLGGEDDVKPAKLVMELPLEIRELTLPFEFHNLELP